MSNDRASLIEKIKALMSKTTDNGCTEFEMEAALAKASAMMEVYEISESDLELTKKEKAILSRVSTGKNKIAEMLGIGISKFTHTEVWRGNGELCFCGLPIDVDLAAFLLKSLVSFTEREMVNYLASTPHSKQDTRALINGFSIGCTNRISARLKDLTINPAPSPKSPKTGTALAIVQNAAIADYKSEHGIHLGRARRSHSRNVDGGAIGAGRAAGDRASFGRPIGHGGTLRLS